MTIEKIKKLDSIKNLVFEIVNADNFRDHQDCVAYSCRGGLCIEFNELQKVAIPNNGHIHTIDTNNMVMLEFEDTMGTTDWLPLAMFDDKIINNLYEVIKDLHKEMDIKKCYILRCDWYYCADEGCDIIRVFNDKEKAQAHFNEFLLNEVKTTWIGEFVDEKGHLYDDRVNAVQVYEYKKDEHFNLIHDDDFTEIYIEERTIF